MNTLVQSRPLLIFAFLVVCGHSALAEGPIVYNRDIRPILAENCFACHGPDSASRKAELRLDRREVAIEATAIVPGKPDESSVVDRIFSSNPDEVMPPPATKKQLTAAQKELLKQWIATGAEYQPHWSFIAPQRPALPAVKDAAWVRNPIDAFVLAKLDSLGLMPAPEADRRTLARRLSLDLTGLPPAPETVEAFVNDPAPDAYEKLVDQLMATPQWGEHRGRYWLDAARYADTHGIHFDNYREIWSYRDWVINAFNRNQPFDQFTLEQLAGDLLPNHTLEQHVASGFNRCNMTTNEGGVIAEEYLVLYTRDRTETTSAVWLGLTAGCAVCHDHKFDPLSQREFYEMAAFFNNTTQGAMDGNVPNSAPVVQVPPPTDRSRTDALPGELAATRQQLEARKQNGKADFNGWLATASAETLSSLAPFASMLLHAPLNEGSGDILDVTVNGQRRSFPMGNLTWEEGRATPKALRMNPNVAVDIPDAGDIEHTQPITFSVWIKMTQPNQSGTIVSRTDEANQRRGWDFSVQANRIGLQFINTHSDKAVKISTPTELKLNEWQHVVATYNGSGKAAGVHVYFNGEPQQITTELDTLTAADSIRSGAQLRLAQRGNGGARLQNAILEDLRIYDRELNADDAGHLAKGEPVVPSAVNLPQASEAEKNAFYNVWLSRVDQVFMPLKAKELALLQEDKTIKSRSTVGYIMQERGEAPMAFILNRGEYDQRKDQVPSDTPDFLPPFPTELPKNRLGFAQWLLRPEHPLTARVNVNRFWQELFGTGIVRTAGDFGISGELPVNQELLDWMAVEFREGGWDVKKFFKLLVTSATYRQAAITTPAKLEKDPANRFCSRGPRFRMDAEMVRDYSLAASGMLVRKIGGPSVKPYQPPGVWEAVAMNVSNTSKYVRDNGENLYRRSMYTFWKRAAPPASMDIFNAPSREVCTVRRDRTNTPLQALVTLNDPQVIEAARNLAEGVLKQGDNDDARVQLLAARVLARPLRVDEVPIVKASLTDLQAYYEAHLDDAKTLISQGESKPDVVLSPAHVAAWTMLANEMFNLDEVLNK
jgi:hypothetical protein